MNSLWGDKIPHNFPGDVCAFAFDRGRLNLTFCTHRQMTPGEKTALYHPVNPHTPGDIYLPFKACSLADYRVYVAGVVALLCPVQKPHSLFK